MLALLAAHRAVIRGIVQRPAASFEPAGGYISPAPIPPYKNAARGRPGTGGATHEKPLLGCI